MKKLFFFLIIYTFATCAYLSAQAKKNLPSNKKQEITAVFKQLKNEVAYLACYYADDKKYLIDSGIIGNDHKVVFRFERPVGGVYLIIFSNREKFVDILIDQSTNFSVDIDTSNLPYSVSFKNSPENSRFYGYQRKMFELQKEFIEIAKDTAHPERIQLYKQRFSRSLDNFKDSITRSLPANSLLVKLFRLFDNPTLPKELEDSSAFTQYLYIKNHYWNGLSFNDKQLLYTPILKGKLDNYFESMVSKSPDSLWKEAKWILDRVDKTDSIIYSFYLNSLLVRFGNSEIMGQDAVFIKIFENYILDKKPEWMKQASYEKMKRGYYMLIGNLIGNKAQDIRLLNLDDKPFSLYDIQADFTVVCFWDPNCSHCQKVVPALDSIYQSKWKSKNVKILGVYVDGGVDNWKRYIKDHHISDWYHGYQTDKMIEDLYKNNIPTTQQSYNIVSTPTIYLLDKDKKIIAKNIDKDTVDKLLAFYMGKDRKE